MARTIARREDEMRRALAQLPLFLLVLLLASNARAQSGIPDGVFVRESGGTTWLVLKGQRVGVPIWQATDADIAAIPASDQWAVLSVNDAGAMVGGSKPAWLDGQAAIQTQTSASPPTAPQPQAVAPVSSGAPVQADVVWLFSDPGQRFVFVIEVKNNTPRAREGTKVRWEAYTPDGVLLTNYTQMMPLIAAGGSHLYVGGAGAFIVKDAVGSVKAVITEEGRATDQTPLTFTYENVKVTKASYPTTAAYYQVSADVTTPSVQLKRSETKLTVIARDAAGRIVGADWEDADALPEIAAPSTRFRLSDTSVPMTAPPSTVEVHGYIGS